MQRSLCLGMEVLLILIIMLLIMLHVALKSPRVLFTPNHLYIYTLMLCVALSALIRSTRTTNGLSTQALSKHAAVISSVVASLCPCLSWKWREL